jgi:hypothetical protein
MRIKSRMPVFLIGMRYFCYFNEIDQTLAGKGIYP